MRRRRTITALAAFATLAAFTTLPMPSAYADTTTDTYIVQLKPGVSADTVVPQIMGSDAEVINKVFQGGIVNLDPADAAALARNPLVATIEKDHIISAGQATTAAAVTQTGAPWNLDELDSPTGAVDGSYTYPNDGAGVIVYVVDSGLQRTHTQFAGVRIGSGYDFVDNDTDPSDCKGHGTAVSSLIAGTTMGAAKGVTIVPIRVLDCQGQGTGSDVVRAAQWIMTNRPSGTPAVANLSLGGTYSPYGTDEAALQGLINSGVTVVASAGNSAANACTSDPAHLPDAVTVAASDQNHAEASFSNYGSCVDLYAPGSSVHVAIAGPTNTLTGTGSGTSFSAPLTTAAVALILHDHPAWASGQVRAELLGQALTGFVTGPGGIPARSVNKLLHVGAATMTGTRPTITGTPFLGQTLQATMHWVPAPTAPVYQWSRNGTPILGATSATHVVAAADLGQPLTVAVTGISPGYYDVAGTSTSVLAVAVPTPGMVVAMTPARLMDSRTGLGAAGPLHAGQTLKLPIAGVGNIMGSVSAVLINITATDTASSGYVTAYASGGVKPATSNVNFTAGMTIPNLALVPVGADGAIMLSIAAATSMSLVVDVQSYIAGGVVGDAAGAVMPVAPARLWDTRQHSTIGPNQALTVQVTGTAGVPDGATAVFLNVTVTEPQGHGYLTVYPAGEARPLASNLNFTPGLTVPNMVLVKVGAGGAVSIVNADSGTAHIVVDLQGYVAAGTPVAAGAVVPVSPVRVVDTRVGLGARGPVAGSSGVVVTIGAPTVPAGTSGVFMNLTVAEPQTVGWVAAYPTQASLPLVSNLNFSGGQTIPNLATVGLANGQATLYNGSGLSVQLVADVFAYIL